MEDFQRRFVSFRECSQTRFPYWKKDNLRIVFVVAHPSTYSCRVARETTPPDFVTGAENMSNCLNIMFFLFKTCLQNILETTHTSTRRDV